MAIDRILSPASARGLWRACCIAVVLVGMAGCGPKLARLDGRVTFQGKPVTGGPLIVFSDSERGIHITAKLDDDGRYRVEMAEGYGLPPGEYQVSIVPPPIIMSADFVEKHRDGPPELIAYPNIPIRYRIPATSGLRLELPPKGATYDVDMQP